MKKIFFALLICVVIPLLSAQECVFYYPQNAGAELVYNNYDKKGKLSGTSTQPVKEYKTTALGAEAIIKVKTTDAKGKDVSEAELNVKCENGIFYFDMENFLGQGMASSAEGMDIVIESKNLEVPSTLKVGDKLKDGWIKMTMTVTGFTLPSTEISVTGREVVVKESITTPAGTFECFKLKQTVSTKGIATYSANSVEWINAGTGLIKNESYGTDGILQSSSELISVKK